MDANIQNVTKIVLGELKPLTGTTFVRSIEILDENGTVLELTLFSGEEKNLKMTITEEKTISI